MSTYFMEGLLALNFQKIIHYFKILLPDWSPVGRSKITKNQDFWDMCRPNLNEIKMFHLRLTCPFRCSHFFYSKVILLFRSIKF